MTAGIFCSHGWNSGGRSAGILIPDYDPRLILDYCSPVQEDKEHIVKSPVLRRIP